MKKEQGTNTSIKVRNLETGQIEYWTIGQLLYRINEDNATDDFNYTLSDWQDGFKDTLEGEFYSLFDKDGNPLNPTPVNDNGVEGKEGFTGGEWEVNNESEPDLTIWAKYKISESTMQNECIATVWANSNTEANACLIAESKNMYETLKGLCNKLENLSMWDKTDTYYYKAKEIINRINKH